MIPGSASMSRQLFEQEKIGEAIDHVAIAFCTLWVITAQEKGKRSKTKKGLIRSLHSIYGPASGV